MPFFEFDFGLAGWLLLSFLSLWKWLFTHLLVSLYLLSQMFNAVLQYRIAFKLEFGFSYQSCMLQNATLQCSGCDMVL